MKDPMRPPNSKIVGNTYVCSKTGEILVAGIGNVGQYEETKKPKVTKPKQSKTTKPKTETKKPEPEIISEKDNNPNNTLY